MTETTVRTERDAAGAFELLATATEDPTVFAVLTDEELLALAGTDAGELAGTPFLDVAGFDREQSLAVALRSLIARGLVVLDDSDRENEGEDLATGEKAKRLAQLDRSLAGLLTLRSSPLALLNLTRRVADQTTSIMVYLFPKGGVLEELITVDGFHHFSIPTREAVPGRLAKYVDQAGVAGAEDGAPIEGTIEFLETGNNEISHRLRDTRALTVVTSAGAADTSQMSIMATSDAVFAMDTPQEETATATVRELSADSLQAILAEALPDPTGL